MRNITGDFIEISGSEISNDLIVSQNAEGLKNSTKQDLQDRTNKTKLLADESHLLREYRFLSVLP